MLPARTSLLLLTALACAAPLRAQDAPAKRKLYSPPSRVFSCEIPSGWQAFEEEDALGPVAHMLGPDNPAGTYRTGLSVRWIERDQPDYVAPQQAVDVMRRSDPASRRSATAVTHMRVAGLLARVFEVVETDVLPLERLPASPEEIHYYVAVIPSGLNYYLVRLSSTRDVYLDFHDVFTDCLKTFQPLGR